MIFFQNYPCMVSSICFNKPPISTWVVCKHQFAYTDPLTVGQEVERTQNLLTVWGPRFSPEMWRRSFQCLCGHPPHPFRAWFPDRGQGGVTGLGSLWAEKGNNQACAQLPLLSQHPEV